MAEYSNRAGYMAFAAACMARGLTPEETQRVWTRHQSDEIPHNNVQEVQEWLERLIAEERDRA